MWAKNIYDCYDISDYAYNICAVYSVGYSQPNRRSLSIPLIENGLAECDCSSMVSWCLWKAGIVDENPWFYTAIEREYLLQHGFVQFWFGSVELERNDILWRKGHTGIYIGEGLQAEAIMDENGQAGYEGTIPGDQIDGETRVVDLTNDWTHVYRYVDGPLKGIDEMTFLFTCDGKYSGHVFFYDGGTVHRVGTQSEQNAIKNAYKIANGKEIVFTHLKDGANLIDCIKRGA